MTRIPFDPLEAAYLLDAYLSYANGEEPRADVVRRVSRALRAAARRAGQRFDGSFRSEKGISAQLARMESTFAEREDPQNPPTKLFRETVELYRENPLAFQNLLAKAKKLAK
ncbi:MAG: hypothetical protein IJM30_03000 [Thermoguttaceae bacterium]|nr:hypothetical protein [Thermoguttaceae bacterium]